MSLQVGSDTKECRKCHIIKSKNDFYKNKTVTASGYKYYYTSQFKVFHRKQTLKQIKKKRDQEETQREASHKRKPPQKEAHMVGN